MSYIMVEYYCHYCDELYESLEDRPAPDKQKHSCGEEADRAISPVRGRVKRGEVARGKNEPPPHGLTTQALADGMPRREWLKRRRKARHKAKIDALRKEF